MSKTSLSSVPRTKHPAGFSLLELMVAMVMTLVITGAMFGLVTTGQGAFRREPALIERQQQIRVAMNRIEADVLGGGLGLGPLVQTFAPNLNGVGLLGVRAAGDANLGGGNSDFLEISLQSVDCPNVRVQNMPGNGVVVQAGDPLPACFPVPGWVLAFYPDGGAKWGWSHQVTGGGTGFNIPGGQQQPGSQMTQFPANANLRCSVDMALTGGVCPATATATPIYFAQMDRIRYELAIDTDGVPGLFRSATGGFNYAAAAFVNPPGAGWQLVARGIEDMQIRYRTLAGWQIAAPVINPTVATPFDNIVREVEVTLWARALGEANLQGESTAAGNGVTAVRGSLVTSIAPRAAQVALMLETNVANRWQ